MLINRQITLYKYIISIYRQTTPTAASSEFSGIPVYTDFGTNYTLVASGVKALFWSAQEELMPTVFGRNRSDSLLTMEKFKVPADTDIVDGDIILCTAGPNNFPGVGDTWVVGGFSQPHTTLAFSNCLTVYATQTDLPDGVI